MAKAKETKADTKEKKAKDNVSDLTIYGNGDAFKLLCKASSQAEGWMKSTKVMNVPHGCLVQVTTQQRNEDGSYALAEALAYVPGQYIAGKGEDRCMCDRDKADSLGGD